MSLLIIVNLNLNFTVLIAANQIQIPIIVGGGVNTSKSAEKLVSSGAGYIVTGTQIEKLPSSSNLLEFTQAVHC